MNHLATQITLPPEIAKFLPAIPGLAKGTVEATAQGWTKVFYRDPITSALIQFKEPPTIVALAELREGYAPRVSAPTIAIPTVPEISPTQITVPTIALPSAPTINIPTIEIPVTTIALPSAPTIEVPAPTISKNPLYALVGYRFTCGWAVAGLCDALNRLMELWDTAIYTLCDAIDTVNDGFLKARKALLDLIAHVKNLRDNAETAVNTGLRDTRNKTQTALDAYRDNIQKSINAGLADAQAKTQASLNTYRDNIQVAVNTGLADSRKKTQVALNQFRDVIQISINTGLNSIIPRLYEMMGLPMPMPTEEERKRLMDMGDFNGDGIIDSADVEIFKKCYVNPTAPGCAVCDLNHDGRIDSVDLTILSVNYGKSISPIAQLLSPAQLRNVTKESFEFYALSPGMKIHYIAVGTRALA